MIIYIISLMRALYVIYFDMVQKTVSPFKFLMLTVLLLKITSMSYFL